MKKGYTIFFLISMFILLVCAVTIFFVGIIYAGEKEELQWKAKALIADFQLKQAQFQQANDVLTSFLKELDQKGFIYKDEVVVEKPKEPPKPETPRKPELPKEKK